MSKSLLLVCLFISQFAFSSEYLVKLKSHSSLKNLNLKNIQLTKSFEIRQGHFLVIEGDESLVSSLQKNDQIEYIEPNYIYSINNINDPGMTRQWALKNTGRNSGGLFSRGKKGVDIKAVKAWKINKGSHDIKIAVIDTGVDYLHEDLKGNILINEEEKNGTEGVDDDGNGYIDDIYGYDFFNNDSDPMDGHGHGTHCSGVIGAQHNSIGIRGVMAKVKILPIQFLSARGSGTLEGAVRAIDYAVKRGVNIMSNSWGGGGDAKALKEAISLAEEAGILFVAAAGNNSSNNDKTPTIPASIDLDNILAVGAMDGRGKKARFSNYGKNTVDVFAPGVKIYSTVRNNKYQNMSGTSMSCPVVSGVAGLIWSKEPELTYSDVKKRLMDNTHRGMRLDKFSASGYIDAFKALTN